MSIIYLYHILIFLFLIFIRSCAEDFQLPIYASGGKKYFPDHTQIQAKEHRNVMQVLPHILNGIDDELTLLAIE